MSATNNMHNLTTLIKRLEAATSRLEDIATSTELPKTSEAAPKGDDESKSDEEPIPEAIQAFDQLINSTVDAYVKQSNELGGEVAKQAAEVLKGFQEQRKFLLITTKATKPDATAYQALLGPINGALEAVTKLKDSNRSSPMYFHLTSVADGIMMLAWVTMENRPHKHVEESLGSAQFFGNRVLKEQKDKDVKQIEWVQSFYQVFRDLTEFIKQNFPSGVSWNARGESALDVSKKLSPGASSDASAGPPPPPPPGPAPMLEIKTDDNRPSASSGGFGAVFSELNKGSDVTRGLRKIDKSEKPRANPPTSRTGSTHREQEASPQSKSLAPNKKPKPENMRVKKPSKKELEGSKWTVENYDKEPEPIEIETTLTQSVLISRCNNTTIILKGKANQVTIENSNRLSLVVDSLVSTVDVVKAQNFALQVIGSLPTVMLDQVDSGQIYFSKESIGTKVFTSKSSGINLNVLSGPDDDYKELPLPSQICSYFDEARSDLVNEIVAHVG